MQLEDLDKRQEYVNEKFVYVPKKKKEDETFKQFNKVMKFVGGN